MCRPREPAYGSDAFRMSAPGVDELLRNKTLLRGIFRFKINSHVLGNVEEGTTLVVVNVLD